MTDDQRRSRGALEGGSPGLATVHDLFSGSGKPRSRRAEPEPEPDENTVVSLDGSRLNQHDLRDMIAQKQAEWQAENAAGPDHAGGPDGPGQALGDTQSGELVQPAWSLPGWGEDPGTSTAKGSEPKQPTERAARRGNGLNRRPRREQTPSNQTPPNQGEPNQGLSTEGVPAEDEAGNAYSRRGGKQRRNGLSRKRPDWRERDERSSGANGADPEAGDPDGLDPATGSARRRPPLDPELEAREILLRQLSAGDRTRAQLAKVLAQKEIPEDVAAAVLDRFEEVDLVDDAAFSRQYVENRHTGKGLAKRALAYELRQKGVADETVREAVDSLSSDDELATARQLVRKKAGSMTKDDPERRLRRLAGMLARKGYGSGVAYQAIREELAELDAEGMFGHPDFD